MNSEDQTGRSSFGQPMVREQSPREVCDLGTTIEQVPIEGYRIEIPTVDRLPIIPRTESKSMKKMDFRAAASDHQ